MATGEDTLSFRVGNLVDVTDNDETQVGTIQQINHESGTCSIKFTVERNLRHQIPLSHVWPSNVLMTVARQRTDKGATVPSLLTPRQVSPRSNATSPAPKQNQQLSPAEKAIRDATKFSPKQENPESHPVYDLLLSGKHLPKGWLRQREHRFHHNREYGKRRFSETEKKIIFRMKMCLCGHPSHSNSLLAHAWGVNRRSINYLVDKLSKRKNLDERVPRSDKGETVFNSESKRKQYFSAYQTFKKAKTMKLDHGFDPKRQSAEEQKKEWDEMSNEDRAPYERTAQEHRRRAPFLEAEILNAMDKRNGAGSWILYQNVARGSPTEPPIVSEWAIRKHFTNKHDFRYKKNKFIPLLGEHHLWKRMDWAEHFWLFWGAAKKLYSNVRIVLLHMDEKWFESNVPRNNNKCLPQYGIVPTPDAVQHTSHIPKILTLCTVGFLPFKNDITKGGIGFKTDFARAGFMEEAKKNTYGRVYHGVGRERGYTMPQEEWNILKRAGEKYFVPAEVTGFVEEVKGKKKFSLKKYFENTLLAKIQTTINEAKNITNCECVARFQWDGAGPHRDDRLTDFLEDEFNLRGWMFVPQPSQSPVTNVLDCGIFAKMSKDVINRKSLVHTKNMLDLDEIWEIAKRSFEDLPFYKIARSFSVNHQVASALYHHEGKDDFAKGDKAMHFNSRQHYLPYYAEREGNRVVVGVVSVDDNTNVSQTEKNKRKLRYEAPDVTDLSPVEFLTNQEADFLAEWWTGPFGQYEDVIERSLIGRF